ncbi:hypothetical protein BC830DRAFT_1082144 [Chytriomyces sp. MP71]|nr:hypothetical protein BC830DRAFT_1082144 [Chytriomyces sp. MP71]
MSNNSADALFWQITGIEYTAAHLSAALSLAGTLLNLSLLRTVWRHSATLVLDSSIGLAIAVLSSFSALHGIAMASMNELWVASDVAGNNNVTGPLDSPATARSISCISYSILSCIFAANLWLASERLWTIKFNQRVPRKYIICLAAGAALFSFSFIASFAVQPGNGVRWTFLPFTNPCANDENGNCMTIASSISTIFYMIGLSGFALSAILVGVVYENGYFAIATIYERQVDCTDRNGRRKAAEHIQLHRGILIRCIVMSVGLVIFYAPTIILVFIDILRPEWFNNVSDMSWTWLISFSTIIPSLDPLWTAVLILIFQDDFKTAYLGDYWLVAMLVQVCCGMFGVLRELVKQRTRCNDDDKMEMTPSSV